MTIFGKLFRPDQNDPGTLIGHLIALAGLLLAQPEGMALFASWIGTLNPAWSWAIPIVLGYLGGAKASQSPTGTTLDQLVPKAAGVWLLPVLWWLGGGAVLLLRA